MITTPDQALERIAARCVFTLKMFKTVLAQAALGFVGGRLAFSR